MQNCRRGLAGFVIGIVVGGHVAAAELPTPVPMAAAQQELFSLAVGCVKQIHEAVNPIQAKLVDRKCQESQERYGQEIANIDGWTGYLDHMEELDGGGVRGIRVSFVVPYQYSAPNMFNANATSKYALPMYVTTGYLPSYRVAEDDPLYAVIAGMRIGQRVKLRGELIQAVVGQNWKYPSEIKVTAKFTSVEPY